MVTLPSWQAEQNTWRSNHTGPSEGRDWCSFCDHLARHHPQQPGHTHTHTKFQRFKELNYTKKPSRKYATFTQANFKTQRLIRQSVSLPAQVPCQTSCECGGTGGSEAPVLPMWGCREAVWPAALWWEVWVPRWSDWSCWCWALEETHWRNREMNTRTGNKVAELRCHQLCFSFPLESQAPFSWHNFTHKSHYLI